MRLESLFVRLYSDTFSMMRDTVSDMRKHIWPEKEQSVEALSKIEERAEEEIKERRSQISSELSGVVRQVGRTDSKIAGVEERLGQLVDKAIQQTRRVESEAQEEISMSFVVIQVHSLIARYGHVPAIRLLQHPWLKERYPSLRILEALRILERDNMISVEGDLNGPDAIVGVRRSQSAKDNQ